MTIFSSKWSKCGVFSLSACPLLPLAWRGLHQDLGANPIEFITHATGDWTLRFLLITLSITPLRKLVNQPALVRFRRRLGLFAFFYGTLHLIAYAWLDKFFDFAGIWKDIGQRPFITAGWIRRLGGHRWRQLHRLIYACAVAGVVHYYWLVKSDVRMPLLYAGALGVLFLYRFGGWVLGLPLRAGSRIVSTHAQASAGVPTRHAESVRHVSNPAAREVFGSD